MGPVRRRVLKQRIRRRHRGCNLLRNCSRSGKWQGRAHPVIVATVIVVLGVVFPMHGTSIVIRAKVNTDSSRNVLDERVAHMQINNWKFAHPGELKTFREKPANAQTHWYQVKAGTDAPRAVRPQVLPRGAPPQAVFPRFGFL